MLQMIKILAVMILLTSGFARGSCLPVNFDPVMLLTEKRELRVTGINVVQTLNPRAIDFADAMRIVDSGSRLQVGAQMLSDLLYLSSKMSTASDRRVVDELFQERAASYVENISNEVQDANVRMQNIKSGGVAAQSALLIVRMQSMQRFFSRCG